ncbi:MAG: hypothetical protein LBK82_09215 [Planctomycetaceae bacterium]|nr:hypothetical protein [Planctomycetaceae bacterium]
MSLISSGNWIPKTLIAVVNLVHCRRVCRRDLLAKGRLPPKPLATQFAIVHLIHCQRVRRRNRSANGCPPLNGKQHHLPSLI